MEKSRLPRLAHQSALERLGEAVHASPDLLRADEPARHLRRRGRDRARPECRRPPAAGPAAKVVATGGGARDGLRRGTA